MKETFENIKELADDILMSIEVGQADWGTVSDGLESIMELCNDGLRNIQSDN